MAIQEIGKVEDFKPIDIREVFRAKNPAMAKFIPGFVYAYLKRILHLDYVNEFLKRNGDKYGLDFIDAVIDEFNVSIEIIGEENFPETGRYIFISNHPLGGFDGMILIHIIGKRFSMVKTLSNDILMNIKNLSEHFVPVNKHGSQSVESVKRIEDLFNSESQIMSFPAGLVSRRRKGVIRDPDWKKSFITKAVSHQRDIVPIHISGHCTNFFYNLSNIRKFLGIKYNLEMFFLPDETYRHRNKHVVVTIGQPISWKTFDKRLPHSGWALKLQDYIYTLPHARERKFEEYFAQ